MCRRHGNNQSPSTGPIISLPVHTHPHLRTLLWMKKLIRKNTKQCIGDKNVVNWNGIQRKMKSSEMIFQKMCKFLSKYFWFYLFHIYQMWKNIFYHMKKLFSTFQKLDRKRLKLTTFAKRNCGQNVFQFTRI